MNAHDCATSEATIGLLRREVMKLQTQLLAARATNGGLARSIAAIFDLINPDAEMAFLFPGQPNKRFFSDEDIRKALVGDE